MSIIFIFSFFISCDVESPVSKLNSENTGDTWTVFIYLCGSDLESEGMAGTYNLNEIKDAYLGENVNVIIETGGAGSWYTSEIDKNKTQRFKVEDGNLVLADEKPLQNMGESRTLSDFIEWGMDNYKSDKNALVMWNHGSGSIGGVAYDENFDYDSLTLPELKNALAHSAKSMNNKFEFIGFDACLMSTIETANILQPYANYLISSQEYEPGGGWAYDEWIGAVADNPGMNGFDAGREICDSYYDKCTYDDTEEMCTLSVTDLSKIPELIKSFDSIADDIYNLSNEPSEFAEFTRNASKAENYGGNSNSEGYTNLVDLGDLIKNVKSQINDNTDLVLESLNDAVVYKKNGSRREFANGISIYYPIKYNVEEASEYEKIAFSEDYKNFIQSRIEDFEDSDDEDSKYFTDIQPYINEDGYYELDLDENSIDYVKDVYFNLFMQENESSNELLYLGIDNNINGDYKSGIFTDAFEGYWPALNGVYLNMNIIEVNDQYNIYSIPIYLNGEETNLRVAWIWDESESSEGYGQYEIIGTWDGISAEGLSSRNVQPLKNGDIIEPIYECYDMNTDEIVEYTGDAVTVDGNIIIEDTLLPQGIYYYDFEIEDIYGQTADTDYATFEIDENGEIFYLQ